MTPAAKLELATQYVRVGFLDGAGFEALTGIPVSEEWVAARRAEYEAEQEEE